MLAERPRPHVASGVDRQIASCWNLIASRMVMTQCTTSSHIRNTNKDIFITLIFNIVPIHCKSMQQIHHASKRTKKYCTSNTYEASNPSLLKRDNHFIMNFFLSELSFFLKDFFFHSSLNKGLDLVCSLFYDSAKIILVCKPVSLYGTFLKGNITVAKFISVEDT